MAFVVSRNHWLVARPIDAIQLDTSSLVIKAAELRTYTDAIGALSAARVHADNIIAEAREEAERQHRLGFEQGLATAKREQAVNMAECIQSANRYLLEIERSLVDLVLQAVRRIAEGFNDEERVANAVRDALAVMRGHKRITLRANPTQVAFLRHDTKRLIDGYAALDVLDVVADDRIAVGACVLESELGIVEASFENQLAAIEDAFKKAWSA